MQRYVECASHTTTLVADGGRERDRLTTGVCDVERRKSGFQMLDVSRTATK